MNNVQFQVLESSDFLDKNTLVREVWFITGKENPIRRTVYRYLGSVVAIKDSGVHIDNHLYVEEQFLEFFKDEPEMVKILMDVGVFSYANLKTFRME